jgi:sec-independent protein translocase protein TatC
MNNTIPIKNHLIELKHRIIYIIISIVFNIVICYYYSKQIIYIISKPIEKIYNNFFIYTSITEVFNTYLLISIYISLYISIITILYHLIMFLYSGLYKNELKKLFLYTIIIILLLIISNYITNTYIIPITYKYFINFEILNEEKIFNIKLMARIYEYCLNYLVISLVINILTLLPVILLLMIRLNIISNAFLNNKRNYIYILLLLIASIITPPEIISLLITYLLLIIIYEISIYLLFIIDIYIYFIYLKKNIINKDIIMK